MTTTKIGIECRFSEWDINDKSNLLFFNYEEHYNIALSFLKGCQQHWKESITRIIRNHSIVPEKRASQFHYLISRLSKVETIMEFNSTVRMIYTEFPNTKSWLE